MTSPTNQKPDVSPLSAESAPDRAETTRSEALQGVFSDPVDPQPQHPPRRKSRVWLLAAAALMIVSLGRAAWPVIDFSAVAQLVEAVRVAQDSLNEMTTSKRALLGEVAALTGIWSDLTGDAYQLGERASGLVTDHSLRGIEADLESRRDIERLAWPTSGDIQDAYAEQPGDVIQQLLVAHQKATLQRDAEQNAWYDAQIVIAEAGQFLDAIQGTAGAQNAETTQGLSTQFDRHIAVSSASRDIAARQLELATSAEHRAARLEHLQAVERANQRRRSLAIRAEIQQALADHQANLDAAAFDESLYTPVLPEYN